MFHTLHTIRKKPVIIILSLIAFLLLVLSLIPRNKPPVPSPPTGGSVPSAHPITPQELYGVPQPSTQSNPQTTTNLPSAGFGTIGKSPSSSPSSTLTNSTSTRYPLSATSLQSFISSLPLTTQDFSIQFNPQTAKFYIAIFTPPYADTQNQLEATLFDLFPEIKNYPLFYIFTPNP